RAFQEEREAAQDLRVRDEDDVVHERAHVLQRVGPGGGRGEAVRDGVDALEARGRAVAQRERHACRALGLDTDDADRGPERLDGGRDAGDEAAAPDRHDDDVGVGRVLEDLEADRALARDDVRVVERVDEREAVLAAQRLALLERLEDGAVEGDVGAVRAARHGLRQRGARARHAPTVERGACAGNTTVQAMPSRPAPYARACAWLPAEMVMRPRARSSAVRRRNRLKTPRTLNEPVLWRHSALRDTRTPAR